MPTQGTKGENVRDTLVFDVGYCTDDTSAIFPQKKPVSMRKSAIGRLLSKTGFCDEMLSEKRVGYFMRICVSVHHCAPLSFWLYLGEILHPPSICDTGIAHLPRQIFYTGAPPTWALLTQAAMHRRIFCDAAEIGVSPGISPAVVVAHSRPDFGRFTRTAQNTKRIRAIPKKEYISIHPSIVGLKLQGTNYIIWIV